MKRRPSMRTAMLAHRRLHHAATATASRQLSPSKQPNSLSRTALHDAVSKRYRVAVGLLKAPRGALWAPGKVAGRGPPSAQGPSPATKLRARYLYIADPQTIVPNRGLICVPHGTCALSDVRREIMWLASNATRDQRTRSLERD
jgi:hypothetical protein